MSGITAAGRAFLACTWPGHQFMEQKERCPQCPRMTESIQEAMDWENEECAKVAMGTLIEKAGNESVEIISSSIVARIRSRVTDRLAHDLKKALG